MSKRSSAQRVPDAAESAEEAGLRYVTDAEPGHQPPARRQRASSTSARWHAHHRPRRSWPGSAAWPSRRPGPMSGSALRDAATCRPPGATHAVASSTATTPNGTRCATTPSTSACSPSARRCRRIRAPGGPRTCADRACRASGCWPPWSGCSRRRACASATRSTRATTSSFGLTTLRDRHAKVGSNAHPLPVPRQGRQGQRGRALGRPAGAHRGPLPGPARAGAVRLPGRGRRGALGRLRPT